MAYLKEHLRFSKNHKFIRACDGMAFNSYLTSANSYLSPKEFKKAMDERMESCCKKCVREYGKRRNEWLKKHA